MDLNSISLPASVVAELFSGVLIEPGETEANSPPNSSVPGEPIQANNWKWLGTNRKNILVLVHYKDAVHIPDDQLKFLTGMLTACKLDIGDVAILNLDKYPGTGYKELIKQFSSKVILMFELEPALLELPINFPQFQIQPFAGNSFLYTPSLETLEKDKVLKSKLWVCLRRLFNI